MYHGFCFLKSSFSSREAVSEENMDFAFAASPVIHCLRDIFLMYAAMAVEFADDPR